MPTSADYVVRETAANLWRNRLMTFAAVLTVAVSLSLVGAALLLKQGAAAASGIWQRETQVTVWMQPHATPGELKAIKTQLAELPYVRQPCVYHDHQWNYDQALHLLGSIYPEAGVTPAQTPTTYQCTPTVPDEVTTVISTFSKQQGVLTVTAPVADIHSMERVIGIIGITALIIAIALLVSAAVLIVNTIRMAIFARRREVSVMKLVGATNWFIRVPFISEGLLQGLVGSAMAAAVVYGLHVLMDHLGTGDANSVINQMRLTGWQVVGTDVIVVLVGVVIGSAGSALAIRRFLDV